MQKLKEIKERFDKKSRLNYKDANDILVLLKKILRIFLVLMIVVTVYIVVRVCKELFILDIVKSILTILTPFFIGIAIAWMLNPIVNYLEKKGVRRIIGTSLSFVILLSILLIIIYSIIPLAYNQLKELSTTIPSIIENGEKLINNVLSNFSNFGDTEDIKQKIFTNMNDIANNVSSKLPNTILMLIKNIISGIGTLLVGLLIGFFLLLGFNNISDSLLIFVPKKFHEDTKTLFSRITKSLHGYVNGALFDATIIFVVCSICFFLIGVKSPVLFGLFCGAMNVIPYAGPYIGAIPALIVAYSQSFTIGLAATISIVIVQGLEGNILSPIVMSKTTKLHPVSIIVGLLIFGHFFGIVGMLLSTPIISVLKVIIEFIDEKINLFNDVDTKEDEI